MMSTMMMYCYWVVPSSTSIFDLFVVAVGVLLIVVSVAIVVVVVVWVVFSFCTLLLRCYVVALLRYSVLSCTVGTS